MSDAYVGCDQEYKLNFDVGSESRRNDRMEEDDQDGDDDDSKSQ